MTMKDEELAWWLGNADVAVQSLSKRQQKVLDCSIVNRTSRQMAKGWGIDGLTVETHFKHIRRIQTTNGPGNPPQYKLLSELRELYRQRHVMIPLRDIYIHAERTSGRTLQEIGDEMGLTRERIRQIYKFVDLVFGQLAGVSQW